MANGKLAAVAHIANLKAQNNVLIKNTMEQREEIQKLQSKLDSLAADHEILDAIQRDIFRDMLSSTLFNAAELATAQLNARATRMDRDLRRLMEETNEGINFLTVERASFDKLFETSYQRLQDIEKKMKAVDDEAEKLFMFLPAIPATIFYAVSLAYVAWTLCSSLCKA